MITEESEIPENAVVSANEESNNVNVYHTTEECRYYPEEVRALEWGDVRASVRWCSFCRWQC